MKKFGYDSDQVICDDCANFYCHPSGNWEVCKEVDGVNWTEEDYNKRFDGETEMCPYFRELIFYYENKY